MVNSTVVQIIQDVDLLCLIRNNHITRSSKPTQAQGLCGLTHVAIFEKIENGMVWFIDSTEYDSDGDGIVDISGVSRRSYPVGEKKIKSYGTMKLRY